ncbi:helix-turn-helix domain-containing protein [Sphingobium sp. YG1]|jgi:transcriptional regulator with XRE-family HTH domain|uniref:helix-turn-helix domain-containing protein n=1 Tax=Sphingobium sp. YG1 TaxID=2082188 RepID=UPI000DBB4743|nr:helix-turn-helix transcriptional regulator [Sphingobium sp. YG1]BBC99116.1 hypothetical protein YGS_C1P0372 [Sphingobium sp. YG1]
MKLAAWRKQEGLSQDELATALDTTQGYVSRIERPARAKDFRMPGLRMMIDIFRRTRGAVTPNDFYDLPKLDAERDAA